MSVKICNTAFDPWSELTLQEQKLQELAGKVGATSIFIGTMRDFNAGDDVQGMTLEYYPGMTEKHLDLIMQEAYAQWSLLDALIVHRVGDILPKDPIVLVAVWTSHRGDAFDACRYIMENLKAKAPFWKKEILNNQQTRWVSSNSSGYA